MSLSIDDDASIPVLTEIIKPAQANLAVGAGLGLSGSVNTSLTASKTQTTDHTQDINAIRESILQQLREHLEPLVANAMQDEIRPLLAQATERISTELHDELRSVIDSVLSGAIYNALTQSLLGEISPKNLTSQTASVYEAANENSPSENIPESIQKKHPE